MLQRFVRVWPAASRRKGSALIRRACTGAILCTLSVLPMLPCGARAEALTCAAPANIAGGWETAGLAEFGFEARALCASLSRVAEGSANIHGVLVERRGRLVAELYRRGADRSIYSLFASDVSFGPTDAHDLRSVSKSVIGLLVGIVMQRGKLPALSTPVLDFYPEFADLRAVDRDAITLEHLLTMTSGLEWHETVTSYGSLSNDETRLYWDWAPYRFVLSRPIAAAAGSQFNYNGGGTAVLADILVRATKQPLRDLAREALFAPLGIEDWEWVGDPYRRPIAFAGLRMRPRDLLKIGRMLLNRGQWQGRQIVPAEWVAQSLRPHIATGTGLSYGYQWWAGSIDWRGRKLAWSAAFGNGGQRLFVVPDLDVALVITAGAYDDPAIAGTVNQLFGQIIAAVQD
jgi:CubicO group peptidase (beta-lactamase class C family)